MAPGMRTGRAMETTTASPADLALPAAEVTVRFYAIEPNEFLDALNMCSPSVVAEIMENVRAGDILHHRCPGAREGHVFWLSTTAPPLPVRFIANHDIRTCGGTWERIVQQQMTGA